MERREAPAALRIPSVPWQQFYPDAAELLT